MKKEIQDENRTITVDYGLRKLTGNVKPYFHVTAHTKLEQSDDLLHKVFEYEPDLRLLESLHLSDDEGVPLHALENGLYWLGFTKWQCYSPEMTVRHFRITCDQANKLHECLQRVSSGKYGELIGMGLNPNESHSMMEARCNSAAEEALNKWIETQKPIWKSQADHAIKTLGLTVEFE